MTISVVAAQAAETAARPRPLGAPSAAWRRSPCDAAARGIAGASRSLHDRAGTVPAFEYIRVIPLFVGGPHPHASPPRSAPYTAPGRLPIEYASTPGDGPGRRRSQTAPTTRRARHVAGPLP